MELAIDTSTKYASLGLSLNGKMVAENQWLSGWNHTVEIGATVRKLLKSNLLSPNNIDSIFIAIGPGGYSSLRTGLSFAKGFAEASGAHIYSVSTLAVQAYPFFSLILVLPISVIISPRFMLLSDAGESFFTSTIITPFT